MQALFSSSKVLEMPYSIFDIETTNPLPSISVPDADTGVAVLLRKEGKPIDFLIEE